MNKKMKAVSNKYHTHISSKHRLFNLKLRETWKYRDLIWLFTKRTLFVSYKQTILGPIWIFLNPLISSLIHAIVFGGIAGLGPDGMPSMVFYLASNAVWIFFSTCVTNNATTFTANASVFGKVYFPRLTVPISNLISSFVQFLVQMILVVAFMIFFGIAEWANFIQIFATGEELLHAAIPKWEALPLLPLVFLHLGALGLGVGLLVSSMTTKYRDLSILVTFGVSLWMYISPIVYPVSKVAENMGTVGPIMEVIMMYNPVTPPIELFRFAVLGLGTWQDMLGMWLPYVISVVVTIILLLFGIMIFNKVERTFMDTV